MLQKFLAALLMAGLTVVAAAETVYKWRDSRGQIHYTDLPPTQADAKILGVFTRETFVEDDFAEGGDEGDDGASGPTTLPSENDSGELDADLEAMAAVQADVASAKNEQCKEAKERYQIYSESRRVFRQTADGKREYLTDQELAEARVRSKQSVDEYCN